ncbi:MAG: hypothetical protein LKI25_04995 [Atopobiaceae bacterium]|nr:hypothetical protein [Atopobiaceae bacterium]MCI2173560.1 hypothetical protein [Atopobiaceae bacterium]
MSLVLPIALGAACGIVGSLPMVVLFERNLSRRGRYDVGHGLAAIMASMALLMLAMGVSYILAEDVCLVFCMATIVTFLALWVWETLRAWRLDRRMP